MEHKFNFIFIARGRKIASWRATRLKSAFVIYGLAIILLRSCSNVPAYCTSTPVFIHTSLNYINFINVNISVIFANINSNMISPFSETPILNKSCLSPKEILEVYGMENEPGIITIKPKTFLEMCPALVYQLDQRSCYKTEAPSPKLSRLWSTYNILINTDLKKMSFIY